MLEVTDLTKRFGGLTALEKVSLKIEDKTIVGLIGPNGAGKTTLFNCISGIYRPTSGSIRFKGREITKLKPSSICKLGIGRTFQIIRVFPNQTVLQNVIAGALFGRDVQDLKEAREIAMQCLGFTELVDKKDILAKNLTLVERRMVELARALATGPKLLLLDELLAGLNPSEVSQATRLIRRIRDELGVTIFWIEHVMRAIMSATDYVIVLNFGKKIAEGRPSEIAKNEKVIQAYLGGEYGEECSS